MFTISPDWARLARYARLALALGGTGLAGAGCVAYGVLIEAHDYTLRQVRLPVLPAGRRPIKVLHLSDLHLQATQTTKTNWVRALAAWHPDFLVNTGDNLAFADALPVLARALEPLAGVPGVFVLGSNDYFSAGPRHPLGYFMTRRWAPARPDLPTAALVRLLEGFGWDNAERSRRDYLIQDSSLEVRGCADAHLDWDDYPAVAGPNTAEVLIGVTHAPYRRVLDQMVDDGAGLILAGHTHGGQVCLPGGRALTTNCDLPTRQARGASRYRHGTRSAWLHVSAGLGTSPYAPYRFCCRPEATLVSLVPAS